MHPRFENWNLRETQDRFIGCLLGGAVGDALGAPLEFMSLDEICSRFGPEGIRDYAPAYGRRGAITDDTQMTLFTLEGMIRAANRSCDRGLCSVETIIYYTYLNWLMTQGVQPGRIKFPDRSNGWLYTIRDLHHRRAPGNTCLSALRSGEMGTVDHPLNDSKGCGGVMRAAPLALMPYDPFKTACGAAAITHGHPSGYLAAGVLAQVIREILEGADLPKAVQLACAELKQNKSHQECLLAVENAVELAAQDKPSPEAVESLGAGWVAEEALAMSIYCALVADDFASGVLLAVNHGGDSDSTGSITGNILGALLGKDAIPGYWLDELELRSTIEELALDAVRHIVISPDYDGRDFEKYPPN